MMHNYYEYEVVVFDFEAEQEISYYGVTCGNSMQDALANVQSFYEESLVSVKLVPWDASICLDMSSDTLDALRKEI